MSLFNRRLQRGTRAIITQATFYVDATRGSDANVGTSTSTSVATLQRAYSLATTRASTSTEPIVIALRGGTYRIANTLSFGALPNNVPLVWTAYGAELPLISGSTIITGWQETTLNGQRAWTVSLATGQTFKSLFVNGESRFRPRLPLACNTPLATYTPIDRKTELYAFDQSTTYESAPSFTYQSSDLNATWANLSDVTVVAMQQWISERMPLTNVTPASRTATIAYRPDGYRAWDGGTAYYVENVKEALSLAGQWYYDKSTGILTYLPQSDESLATSTITIPVASQLLTLTNAVNHTFRGITFAETDWTHLTSCSQGANASPGVITTKNSRNITFESCTVRDVGFCGFNFTDSTTDTIVDNCDIYNVGSCGVKITSDGNNYSTRLVTVRNSRIHHGGMYFHQACGVLAQDVRDVTIANNAIHDFFYSGVSVGWNWTFGETLAGNNIVESNTIEHVGKYLLSDMGGIYTLGRQAGTILRDNIIHDVQAYQSPGTGIYFDQGSALITCTGNTVYDNIEGIWSPNYSSGVDITYNIVTDNQRFQIGAHNNVSGTIPSDLPNYRIKCTNNIITSHGSWLFPTDTLQTISDNNLLWDFNGSLATLPNAPLRLHLNDRTTHAVLATAAITNPYSPTHSFIYQPLTSSVTLAANTSYYMLADVSNGGGKWQSNALLPTTTDAKIIGDVYKNGTDSYAENISGSYGYGPFTFTYTTGAGASKNFVTATGANASLRNDYTGELGYAFTVGASPITVTSLGTWALTPASPSWWLNWQGAGQDTHSLVADPLYLTGSSQPFALSPSSPAHAAPVSFP